MPYEVKIAYTEIGDVAISEACFTFSGEGPFCYPVVARHIVLPVTTLVLLLEIFNLARVSIVVFIAKIWLVQNFWTDKLLSLIDQSHEFLGPSHQLPQRNRTGLMCLIESSSFELLWKINHKL